MTQNVLILGGNGKIGSHAAEAFWKSGWTVRHYNRETDDMAKVAKGCEIIVNGLNPPNYANWAKNIPAITSQVIAAAQASGATVIVPGNIYNFGNQTGELNESTSHMAATRKGKIRIAMEHSYRVSGIQTIILRAGNFIDPNHNGDIMSLFIMREVKSGKLLHGGRPDARNAYAYVPDWARAAVRLAEMRHQLAQFEDIPFPGHNFTWRELKTHLEECTGKPYRLAAFPWWFMTAMSPFMEMAREFREMRYLYEMDHYIGPKKFNRLLPDFEATPLLQVMEAGLPSDLAHNMMTDVMHKRAF